MINNENGRSMVEMLGVLAIIGVLSVAGIAGYSMAMKKYRTNEIVNAISMMAVAAQTGNYAANASYNDVYGVNAPAGASITITDSTHLSVTSADLCSEVKNQLSGGFMTAGTCSSTGVVTITLS